MLEKSGFVIRKGDDFGATIVTDFFDFGFRRFSDGLNRRKSENRKNDSNWPKFGNKTLRDVPENQDIVGS